MATENSTAAYPVPFANELNLRVGEVNLADVRVQMIHSYGQTHEISPNQVSVTEEGLLINGTDLPNGPYTVLIWHAGRVRTFYVSKQ